MKLKKKTQKYLQIGAIALGGILLVGATAAIVGDEKEKTLDSLFGYQVAAIETDGDLDSSAKTNIVSNFVKVDGLKVIVENEDISFKLHYFDDDKEYLSASESMTEFDSTAEDVTVPVGADYVRVEFTHAEDDKITFGERLEYLKDVEVIYEK